MSTRAISRQGFTGAFLRLLKVGLLILLYYLVQVNVMPHLKVAGVMPNLLMICIAILTVTMGKKYAFAGGACIGILLETMAPDMRLFNLIMYPALGLLCAQVFADMSEIKRELKRIRIAQRQKELGRSQVVVGDQKRRIRLSLRRNTANDLNPHLRILLNTLMLTALYEMVMLIYIALTGVTIGFRHLGQVFNTRMYTALCSVLMFPTRAFLGMYRLRRRGADSGQGIGEVVEISEKVLRSISLEPDMPSAAAAGFSGALKRDAAPPDAAQAEQEKEAAPIKEADEAEKNSETEQSSEAEGEEKQL